MVLATGVLANTLVLSNQKVIEEKMMSYRAQELAMNIEMISDFQNPGYMRVDFPVKYDILFEDVGPGETNMTLKFQRKEAETTIDVELEPSSERFIEDTKNLCIREDLPVNGFFAAAPPWLWGAPKSDGDVEDGDNDYETGGGPDGRDGYVQVYNTSTYGGGAC